MTFKTSLVAACVVALLGTSSVAFAQTAAPAAPAAAAPAAAMPAKAMKKSSSTRTAASMACSKDADAQNIHGKARKKFMRDCKKNGGTAPAAQ
ncbi:PsiF family protein [Methylovirgula sp. 4M-Z18]|uniref:PsiF family protein n=1 Tax=Methylovirgula sp. 4M-Z18 TaxID=2293567 RepID=UPI000E2E5315|nr:PsiF family protein [Methylovirgula sp. 4M-Z18]RFB79625.1 phosphate starvation-inducible protein PsiF [Methylovirgula sp. 4M-Z18]